MITDINYLESGLSEEFSSFLNPVEESRQEEPCTEKIKQDMKEVEDTERYIRPNELETSLINGDEFVDTISYKDMKDVYGTVFGTSPTDSIIYAGAFDSYIQSQMDNELRLNESVMMYINEADGGTTVKGSNRRIQDFVAAKWDNFCKFADGILDRYWQAMNKIVNSQKNYLEKYSNTILKQAPREDIEYEYTGDYIEGVDRCLHTEMPVFNYERDAAFLRQEGYEAAVKDFMSGKNFKYNKDEDLAIQFKNWFIAAERGTSKGKLSNLKMQNLYDFCYNAKTAEDAVKKDRNNLNQTKNNLINAVLKELRERDENTVDTKVEDDTATKTTTDGGSSANSTPNNTPTTTANTTQESVINNDIRNAWVSLSEAGEGQGGGDNNQNDNGAGKTGLQITNNTPDKKDANGNTANQGENNAAGKTSTTEQDIKNILNKWTNISRSFLTGKLTAIQQISKDYMNLIKAHVRSYGGKGTDGDKENKNNEEQNAEGSQNQQENKK